MDSFRGHLTDKVKATCAERNVIQSIIPGGMTARLQPLDIAVNKSFKAELKKRYRERIAHLNNAGDVNRTLSEQNLAFITTCVRDAWNAVYERTVIKGFEKMSEMC